MADTISADEDVNPLDALDDHSSSASAAPGATDANPLDALDSPSVVATTGQHMRSALKQTGDQLPEVTVSARGGPDATWSDVGSALSPTIGAKIESKLGGFEEYRGNEKYDSARKKLWQSMILPEAVRSARDKGIPLTEDDQVVDIARHLGIRPDQFTRDWPDYANQTHEERRDFQAAQRDRIQQAQPLMEEGGKRRRMAAQVSEDVRPNMRGVGLKSIAFDSATMIPDLLAGTAATLATGPIGGAAFMAADIAPDEYAAARNEGLDHRHAETYATLATLASSVPEIPVFKILDSAPAAKKIIGSVVGEKFGATVPGKVIGTSVAQGVTQATVQTLQEGIDEGLLDRHDSLPDALKKIAAAGLTGAAVGAPMGALHAAMHREPKPTTFRDIQGAGETPPGPSGLEAAAAAAGPSTEQAIGAPLGGNSSGGVNPEVERGTIEAPAQAEGAHPAQRPIPALIEPGQAPHTVETKGGAETGKPLPVMTSESGEEGTVPPQLSGAALREALEAVQTKTISPPQLEALERMKLATRNDVNVPRLLPAGRRELVKPTPEPEQQTVATANIVPETGGLTGKEGQKPVNEPESASGDQKEASKQAEVAPEPAKISQIRPKRARPAAVEPDLPPSTGGNRYLEDPELRDALSSMKNETGWAQVGGRVLRNEETGQVTGRTTWIPNAEWWRDRPKGLTEPQVHAAVDKALAGKKLSPREQRMVDFMRDVHNQRSKLDPFLPEPSDMPADYDLQDHNTVPVDDAHETALVARLAELDESALESYAKQHEDDRRGFLRAIKDHLDAHDREAIGAGSESREEAAGVAEKTKGLDLFGQDTGRAQDLADEIRRRDQQRSPNKDVSADTGRPGDLFSTNANRQMDLTEGHRHERTHSAGGHNVGDIVRIDAPGNEHHGERAKVLSIHRYRADEPFMARVGHEQGGQQTLDLGQLKPSGQQDLVQQLEQARKETNTNPTDAQKLAGNYKKGTVSFGGMSVAIENPLGSTRTGQSAEGKTWRRKMHADYGYVKGTEGKDGDAVDVFLTGHPDSGKVFVINQNHPDGSFDEHKAILGASNKQEAEATYLKHYPKGWKGLGSMAELSTEAFKEWVNSKKARQPIRTTERRTDVTERKRVTEMTPEEMRKALLTHELTGIPNRRAYVEAPKLPAQVSIDVDSLKWVNDSMGHESGNALLRAVAESLSQHSDMVYHLSGDEFALQALHAREADEVMARVAEQLKGATIEVEMPDGHIVKLNGLGVSYGVGKDLHEADAALQQHKSRREKEGHRAPRGEAPPGAIVRPGEEGREDQARGSAEKDVTGVSEPADPQFQKDVTALADQVKKDLDLEEFDLRALPSGDVRLELLMVPRGLRQMGKGSQAMDRLTQWADEHGRRLVLGVAGREKLADWGTTSKGRLEKFYRRFGFTANKGKNKDYQLSPSDTMYRTPRQTTQVREDAATYSPVSPLAGGVEDRRPRTAPGQGSLDLFAPRDNPTPAARAARAIEAAQPKEPPRPAEVGTPTAGRGRTVLVNTGSFKSGIWHVRDWKDAAHIFAPLRKEPRESLLALVTNAAGHPLAMIRHTTGTATGSLIEPHTLFGAIARVPGAKEFWLGHNHPSGEISQSDADHSVAARMQELARGSGIDMRGSIVVSPGNKLASLHIPRKVEGINEAIRPRPRTPGTEIPIQERRITRVAPIEGRTNLLTQDDAERAVRATGANSGVLMLNARLQVVGHIPITNQEMVKLRSGDPASGTARILKEFESANALQAVPFGDVHGAVNNLGGMLHKAGIRILETVIRGQGDIVKAIGPTHAAHFFSKRRAVPFMKWFGKSKVSAPDGEPLRVFHGTNQPIEDFDAERLGMMTKAVSAKEGFFFTDSASVASEYAELAGAKQRYDMPQYEQKMKEFEEAVQAGELHARRTGDWEKYERAMEAWETHDIGSLRANEIEGQNVLPVYLKMENPLVHDFEGDTPSTGDVRDLIQTAKLQGHDGVIMKRVVDSAKRTVSNHYVVFKPDQIRSAITLKAQAQPGGEGMAVKDLERVVHQSINQSGLGANFPHVQVHGGIMTLPHDLRIHVSGTKENLAQALYDSGTGQIHLLAPNIHNELEARNALWHEAVGHHGLRAAMDPERYNEVMDGLYRDMPERVQDAAYRNGLDLNDPTERRVAAEEVIAYAAGQIMTGQPVEAPILPWWTKAVRAVKAFFAKVTGTPFYDDKAIAGLVQEAQTALERGTSFNGLNEGAARSQHAERFYSPVERAVGESKQAKASADQWLATIKKMAGVKPEELEWLGLEPWLKAHDGAITKTELQDYIRANRLDLEETVHTDKPLVGERSEAEQKLLALEAQQRNLAEALRAQGHGVQFDMDTGHLEHIRFKDGTDENALPPELMQAVRALHDVSGEVARARQEFTAEDDVEHSRPNMSAQYHDFTLPGGKDYRELLMRLPERPEPENVGPKGWHRIGTMEAANSNNYQSGHFSEANILAHVRFKERTDPDGKRVLFLEELQSDWHQAGRRRGYRDEAKVADLAARNVAAKAKYQESLAAAEQAQSGPVDKWQAANRDAAMANHAQQQIERELIQAKESPPDAPFKTTWPMLIMKRMVRWAAEHGFDRIAWTTGNQQNDRYSLSDHVDKITYSKDIDGNVWVYLENKGQGVTDLNNEALTPDRLREIFGESVAQKMLNDEGHMASIDATQKFPERELTGLDLTIGGEGMRGFYDEILPRDTNKLIKKFGARVGTVEIGRGPVHVTEDEDGNFVEHATLEAAESYLEGVNGAYQGVNMSEPRPVHGFDLTPEMRTAALSQGFPLFAKRQAALPLQQPGPRGFYERVRKAVDWLMENPVTRDVRKLTAPTNLSAESKEAARVAREYLGAQAAWGQRSQEALEHFSRQIDKLPVQEQLEMMDRIEHGLPQQHPELQPAADGMRQMLDTWRDKVRGLGTGALDNFIEDYFPHYWADPGDAKRLVASIQGRRPLKGPASFLKLRTIPTIKEGMDAGLKPLTINPLVMTLLKTREMQRFVTGVTLMKRFKEDGLAQFLKSGRPMPDGWAPINDNSAKVRSWSEEEGGWIERGQYIMPEDAARVINNHVSQSWLKSFAPAQAFRVGANLLNALQLGFSAFHLGFTTLDAIISKTALGMESLLHGEVGKAARNFGEVTLGPLAAVNNVRRGYKLLEAYTNPAGATPELAKIVKALEVAGGRAHMDKYYMLSEGVSPFRGVGVRSLAKDIHSALTQPTDRIRNVGKAVGNFAPEYATKLLRGLQTLSKTHTPLEMPFEVAGRLVRASTSWIMEHLVPMQKLGVFSDLANAHIERHPTENPNDQAEALQRIWASVDNRLGEMVYDNLFWNRTFKDVLHFGIRAVGWNVGTVREIAGSPVDAMALIDKAIRTGKITADDVGHKIPYVLAMTMTTALYGAILNYLFTGDGPQEAKDYFFPRTGGETNYGTPQRVSLPSYVKDVYEYSQRPGHTVLNKLNPIFNVIGEMWNNEDFFGNPITDPDAGFWKSLEQRGAFVAGEAKPFSLQGSQQLAGSEKPGAVGAIKRVGPYVGLSPAPGYVTSPDQMERRERSEREKKYAAHLKYLLNKAVAAKDTAEIARLRQEYIDAQINAKKTQVEVQKDRARSAISRRKAATSMRQHGLPATANLVASLPLEPDATALKYFQDQLAAAA